MSNFAFHLPEVRARFPALSRRHGDQPAVFFDGPAGSQVPQAVIDAISAYLTTHNANHAGVFATSRESDAALDEAHAAAADLFGSSEPECTYFGANMTTLTFALSRSLARTWCAGDEIIVSRLDHDANFTPWVLAAQDAGASVRYVDIHPSDCTLNLESFHAQLSARTRHVSIGAASNAVGTVNPVAQIARAAKAVGATVFVDAVHYAPHLRLNVAELGADFVVCSAYKFFGPHIGIMWGSRRLLESLTAYKVRPASNDLPGRWMTGTQNHEGICGVRAAIDYLADVGRMVQPAPPANPTAALEAPALTRSQALDAAYQVITEYEQQLSLALLDGLQALPNIRLFGITDPARVAERVPTFSIQHRQLPARAVADSLAAAGIYVWHGNFYALPLTEALGVEPQGLVRIGLMHYNTRAEIERLIEALRRLG